MRLSTFQSVVDNRIELKAVACCDVVSYVNQMRMEASHARFVARFYGAYEDEECKGVVREEITFHDTT